jgi:hypothetical protein
MAGGIEVPIVSTFNGKGIAEAQRDLRNLETQAGSAGGVMGGLGKSAALLGGAMAAAFSVTAITEFFKSAAEGALADEAAMKSLAVSLDNVNQGYRSTDVNQFIDSLSLASGTADDILRPALQQLVTVTGDVTASQGALKLAMDVAAGGSKSVAEVSAALSAAYAGNFTAITRLKTGIDANIIATKDMDKITAALSDRYAGQASAAAESYQGRLSRLSVVANEAKEQIGYALLGAVSDVADAMGGTGGAAQAAKEMANGLSGLIGNVGKALTLIAGLGTATSKTADIQDEYSTKTLRDLLGLLGPISLGTRELLQANEDAARAEGEHAKSLQVLSDRYMGVAAAAVTAQAAMDGAKRQKAVGALGDRYTAYARSFPGTSISQIGGNLSTYFDEPTTTGGGGGGGVSSATTAATKAAEAFAAAQEKVKAKVDAARKSTQDAIRTFDDYAKSASDAISAKLSIGTAVDLFNQRAADVKTALKDLVDYQAQLSDEQTDAEKKKVEELQAIYRGAQEQAAVGGASIVDTFVAQAQKVSEFGRKMQQLLAAGLNETSFKEISSMSLERGMQTADAFLDGNIAENIRRTNEAVGSVKNVADAVGLDAAKQFATVGIQMAISMIQALLESIKPTGTGRKALLAMMDDLAASLNRTSYITIVTTNADGGSATSYTGGAPGESGSLTPEEQANLDFYLSGGIGGISGFAGGGLATGTFLVGEAGPEIMSIGSRSAYVTPNSALGGGNSYSITVNAGVGDPRMIGQQVVQYIKRFEQASGPVFASA